MGSRQNLLSLALFFFLVGVILLSLNTGAVEALDAQVFYELRLPRTLAGIFVGGGLAVSGLLLQSATGNGLAEPFTLGIAAAAALGAVIGVVLRLESYSSFLGPSLSAFAMALLSIVFLFLFLKDRFRNPTEVLLTGAISGFFYSAVSMLLLAFSDPTSWTRSVGWLFGSLAGPDLPKSIAGLTCISLLSVIGWVHWRDLDLIAVDESSAQTMGVNVIRTRKRAFILVTIMTAVCVASTGVIGFVGLIAPHCLRRLGSSSHRQLLPQSFVFGAVIVLLADCVARKVLAPAEVPVGIMLALIGAPLFLFKIRRQK